MDGRTLDTWTEETTGSNLGEGGTDMSSWRAGCLPSSTKARSSHMLISLVFV